MRIQQKAIISGLLISLGSGLVLGCAPATAQDAAAAPPAELQQQIDYYFKLAVDNVFAPVLFCNIGGIPLIILVLVLGGIFFTTRYHFVNVRLFRHAIDIVRGRYDNPDDPGEISHFKALTSALAATVGLGNIAGVAVAISAGGPGAVFWMWCTAFFGMSMKFSSCTLAQVYREVDAMATSWAGPWCT
jgi:AGCS family alanine or glycine:cation symporter